MMQNKYGDDSILKNSTHLNQQKEQTLMKYSVEKGGTLWYRLKI